MLENCFSFECRGDAVAPIPADVFSSGVLPAPTQYAGAQPRDSMEIRSECHNYVVRTSPTGSDADGPEGA